MEYQLPGWVLSPDTPWNAVRTSRNARTQSNKSGCMGGPSTRIWKWGGGFESLLNGFSIGPSAHLDLGWKADAAIYPHLPQTQLSVGPHPELQGDLSLPGRNTGDDQEEAEQSGVLFFLTPPPC